MDTDEEDTGEPGMTHMSNIVKEKNKNIYWIEGWIQGEKDWFRLEATYMESPKRLYNFLAKAQFKRYAGQVLKHLVNYKPRKADTFGWKKITGDTTLERLATEHKEEQAASRKLLAADCLRKVSCVLL
jgi:hypothetical protein